MMMPLLTQRRRLVILGTDAGLAVAFSLSSDAFDRALAVYFLVCGCLAAFVATLGLEERRS